MERKEQTALQPAMELYKIEKSFSKKKVLNQLDFTIPQGKILGLLGPNGSGKTTLLHLITGLSRPDAGEIKLFGKKLGPRERKDIAYLPDECFFKEGSIGRARKIYQDFYPDFSASRWKELLDFMNLTEDLSIRNLSRGMKEKFALSLVLSREAPLFLLDEPISGIDPVAREEVIEALLQRMNENITMIITTHIIHDLEPLFDEVLFLKDGEVALYGPAEELRQTKGLSMDQLYCEIFGGRHV